MSEVVDRDFTADLALAMFQSSKDKAYTDFKIRAGSRTVLCHRVVICASSDYFKTLCKTGITEATVDNAILTEGDGEILEAIVKYLYLGSSTITASNVQGMAIAADFVALPRLIEKCEEFMVANLCVDKLLPYDQLAKQMKMVHLSASCLQLAKDKFNEVVSTHWFMSLNMEEVHAYLQADDLQAETEDAVMQALVRWLENCGAGNEVKERYAERLYLCVRFSKCSKEKLKELSKSRKIPNFLKLKMLEYLQHGVQEGSTEARRLHSTDSTVSRAAAATAPSPPTAKVVAARGNPTKRTAATPPAGPDEEQVLLIGGNTTNFKVHENVVFLNKQAKDSILTRAPLCVDQLAVSVCAAPGGFIASGGYNNTTNTTTSRVQMFSLEDQSWCDLPDMLYPRYNHGSVCTNKRFFAAGGRHFEKGELKTCYASVNILDLGTLAWIDCQALPIAVLSLGVASVDTDIYVFGGSDCNGATTHVCKYDSHTGKRIDCKPMPKGCSPFNRAVAVGRVVFVLHADSSLFMQYDTHINQWCAIDIPSPLKVAKHSAMVLYKNRIMVIGGYESLYRNPHNLVQSYDIENKTWCVEKQTTPLPLLYHAAIVVKMPCRK